MAGTGVETTDKRVQRSKAAVLTQTYVLLSECGIGGVSIDEVSRRSGISKTTIYRHWPSRNALLLDACTKMGPRMDPPDTGSLQGDLITLADTLAEQLRSARWPAVLPSIIDAAERDSNVAEVQAALHVQFSTPFLLVAERAQARGELPPCCSPAQIVASVMGPLFYRRWFSKEPINPEFVKDVVKNVAGLSDRHSA